MTDIAPQPMTSLERRYRRLLLAYPERYRAAHGDELVDVLLESADPGRNVPVLREAWGLLVGGVRSRVVHLATGSAWDDGLHLGVTAVAAVNLAALLPYAGVLPLWTLLSALALLAVLRGLLSVAFALTLIVGVKAIAVAGGWQVLDLTVLPVYPSVLADRALFADGSPFVVAWAYAVVLLGLLVLMSRRREAPRIRSWWWPVVVLAVAWTGPQWMEAGTLFPISLSRMLMEVATFGLAVAGGYLARDHRWSLASGIYLLVRSVELTAGSGLLTRQHLAYWGVLAVLALGAGSAPFLRWWHCPD